MWMTDLIRRAASDDVEARATTINAWIERTEWMLRRITYNELVPIFREGLPKREAYVIGNLVEGYLSMDPSEAHIWGFYVATPRRGLRRALLDHAKAGRNYLRFNRHRSNLNAHNFYYAQGFVRTGEPWPGDDGIDEIRMEWHA